MARTNQMKKIRNFAAGGLTIDPEIAQNPSGYTPTAGEQKMLGEFNNRMAEFGIKGTSAGTASITPTIAPSSAGVEEIGPVVPDMWKPYQWESIRRPSVAPQLGFADGGKLDPDELMRQMSAKYGAGPVQQPAAQQQAPQPQPQQKAQQLPPGLLPGIFGVLKGRQQQIDKAVGYANGKSPKGRPSDAAIASMGLTVGLGGKIEGPGTPTSDSIPAAIRETGEPIKVSTDERILSKSQDSFLEEIALASGFDSLNAMLEAATGQPVGPTIKAGRRAAATGMEPEREPEQQRPAALDIDPSIASALAAPPTLGGGSIARSEPTGGPLSSAAAVYRPELNGITWNAKGFDPTKENMVPGTGAIAITSGPNAGKNIAVGQQNYTAADGSSTSDWSKTAQYAQGVAQAKKDRETLAMMQRDRLERDAYSAETTDPRLQINARQQLHDIDAKASKEGETYGRMLDNQTKLAKLNSDGQMSGLQSQYLAETDPTRREALAERIRGVQGKRLESVGRGSQTASRAAGLGDLDMSAVTEAGNAARSAATGNVSGLVNAAAKAWNRVATPEPVRDEMGRLLTAKGEQGAKNLTEIRGIVQQILKERAKRATQAGAFSGSQQ